MQAVRKIKKFAVPVVGSLVLAVGLTACGGGGTSGGDGKKSGASASQRMNAGAVLAAAAKKTREQNSYRTRQSGGSSEDGVTDMAWQRTPFFSSMQVHGKKTKDNPSGETYLVDTADGAYTKTDKIPGKDWFKIDPSSDKKSDRSRSRGLLTEFLGALNATGTAKWIGTEQVGGRPTDHFQGTVTIAELAKYQGPAMDKESHDWYVDVMQKGGKEQAVIDVWVGKDGLVAKSREVSSGKKGQEQIVEEYSDYGTGLKAEVPPADRVATFDEYIQALANGPSA
ncbi:hypothetical protein [Streptomyces sp. WM6378]|uniref:hypothetical protein n=1 Tax=Streptomyces sp. WM6378 TaxID=1415557 RepID=UPI000AE66CE8|nr:hypothetical protein [Streptomyces sp. WM6378]